MDTLTSLSAAQVNRSCNNTPAVPPAEKPLWQTPEIVTLDCEETLAGGPGVTDAGFLS